MKNLTNYAACLKSALSLLLVCWLYLGFNPATAKTEPSFDRLVAVATQRLDLLMAQNQRNDLIGKSHLNKYLVYLDPQDFWGEGDWVQDKSGIITDAQLTQLNSLAQAGKSEMKEARFYMVYIKDFTLKLRDNLGGKITYSTLKKLAEDSTALEKSFKKPLQQALSSIFKRYKNDQINQILYVKGSIISQYSNTAQRDFFFSFLNQGDKLGKPSARNYIHHKVKAGKPKNERIYDDLENTVISLNRSLRDLMSDQAGTQQFEYRSTCDLEGSLEDHLNQSLAASGTAEPQAIQALSSHIAGKLSGKKWAILYSGHLPENHQRKTCFDLLSLTLEHEDIFSQTAFENAGFQFFEYSPEDWRYIGYDVILANYDPWQGIPENYNYNSYDYTDFDLPLFDSPEVAWQQIDIFEDICTYTLASAAYQNQLHPRQIKNIWKKLDQWRNPNQSQSRAEVREYLLEYYRVLGAFGPYEYDLYDLSERRKIFELENDQFNQVIQNLEAQGTAYPLDRRNDVAQYRAQFGTHKAFYFGLPLLEFAMDILDVDPSLPRIKRSTSQHNQKNFAFNRKNLSGNALLGKNNTRLIANGEKVKGFNQKLKEGPRSNPKKSGRSQAVVSGQRITQKKWHRQQ